MPATLGEAIATEPTWLQGWLFVLGGVQLLAILFLVTRGQGRWRVRPEPVAILLSLPLAAVSMEWLYAQVGFVRLLGLAHLVYWTPVRLEFPILSLNRGLRSRCVSPDVWPTLSRA